MATAKKLPSGSWRCLVYSHSVPVLDEKGMPVLDAKGKPKEKRIYESFTSNDPSRYGKLEAEQAALDFLANWILRCGGAASPVWREPPVRTNGATY